MLPFIDEIVRETHSADSLQVVGKGLGVHHAITTFIGSAVDDKSVVLGINISRPSATTFIWPALQCAAYSLPPMKAALLLPRFLNSDYTARDRTAVYNGSGFIVVTSAILVHDLLHDTLPVDRVSGIVVFAADQIKERSNEHFCLSLFRARNRTAFIKAFSDNAGGLARGFHTAEKLMRMLYVSRLVLWPRFHKSVRRALRAHVLDLVDLAVQPSPRVVTMLAALRDTVFAVLTDLKAMIRTIDFSDLYLEKPGIMNSSERTATTSRGLMVSNFDDVVRRQIDGSDLFISPRARSLLADLTVLRALIRDAYNLDAVQFYQRIVTLRHAAQRGHSWLVRKEAQAAVLMARSRVWVVRKGHFDRKERKEKAETANVEKNAADLVCEPSKDLVTIPTLESCPKWKVLCDVLNEIRTDIHCAGGNADVGRVLIIVREKRTVDELRTVLIDSETVHLRKQFEHIFPSVAQRAAQSDAHDGMQQITMTQFVVPENAQQCRKASGAQNVVSNDRGQRDKNLVHRSRTKRTHSYRGTNMSSEEKVGSILEDVFQEVGSESSTDLEVLLWCMEWVDVEGRGHRVLDEHRPAFVILYHADLAFVRQVEVYKAANPGRPVRMYILSYDDSVEEERFRYASEREKVAFKTLIRERATMTVHFDQEGRLPEVDFSQHILSRGDDALLPKRGLGKDRDSRRSNSLDGASMSKQQCVIVDTRELRSSLPMLLHQSKLTIVPITLEVGDFILSNDIGIERKTVPDLHGSFGSGRLFNQAEALCRHYKHPCLLIELDTDRSLSLAAVSGGVPSELLATSILSKMVLLVQQFSSLRLLWARGPHDAAELFGRLKEHEGQPDPKIAAKLGVDSKESDDQTFNTGPQALLRSLPGIDSHNMNRVMRKVRNVATLVNMSITEMKDVLGSAAKATKLLNFVNETPSEALAAL